ncbi:MAG: hypothetical protein HKN30_13360 [Sulfitobacter sp.]|nr:hypothetical protein [Sulfitobacter sp.]
MVWANTQPYAGQETRDIASLSAQDIDDLVNGRGWGFAKAAELNGFPGPAHILELADELSLTAAQRHQVKEVFDRMNGKAREIGVAFIEAEGALDAAFEVETITAERLGELTAQSGALRAKLRAVHLAAHLEVKPVLSRHQIMIYNQARGYADGEGHANHGHDQ